MTDFPTPVLGGSLADGILSSAGQGSTVADACLIANAGFTSAAIWPTANKAFYIPVLVWEPITVYKMAWLNGATVSGNVDVGIYSEQGTRLVSLGSTAQAGASVAQVADITDTPLTPGLYYLAMAMNNIVGTVQRSSASAAVTLRTAGYAVQTTAFALPATATFAGADTGFVPLLAAIYASSTF